MKQVAWFRGLLNFWTGLSKGSKDLGLVGALPALYKLILGRGGVCRLSTPNFPSGHGLSGKSLDKRLGSGSPGLDASGMPFQACRLSP